MWVWYCRPPIGAHFHPTPQPHPFPMGEKAHLRIAWSVAALRRPPVALVLLLLLLLLETWHSTSTVCWSLLIWDSKTHGLGLRRSTAAQICISAENSHLVPVHCWHDADDGCHRPVILLLCDSACIVCVSGTRDAGQSADCDRGVDRTASGACVRSLWTIAGKIRRAFVNRLITSARKCTLYPASVCLSVCLCYHESSLRDMVIKLDARQFNTQSTTNADTRSFYACGS